MSTRSCIGIENADGSVTTIYCHSDGYLECVGAMLSKHYSDPKKVKELIALGSISSLGEEIGTKHDFDAKVDKECNVYHRDRNDPQRNTKPTKYKSLAEQATTGAENCGADYVYCFRIDGRWWWQKGYGDKRTWRALPQHSVYDEKRKTVQPVPDWYRRAVELLDLDDDYRKRQFTGSPELQRLCNDVELQAAFHSAIMLESNDEALLLILKTGKVAA
jgi:hypothetical protein